MYSLLEKARREEEDGGDEVSTRRSRRKRWGRRDVRCHDDLVVDAPPEERRSERREGENGQQIKFTKGSSFENEGRDASVS